MNISPLVDWFGNKANLIFKLPKMIQKGGLSAADVTFDEHSERLIVASVFGRHFAW